MRNDKKDVVGTHFIEDENGNHKIKESEFRERRKRYFETLLNDENNNELEKESPVEGPIQEVTEGDVNKALKGMKNNKAPRPSGLTNDLLEKAGKTGIRELTKTFKKVVQKNGIKA